MFFVSQGTKKVFASLNSLIVHHSIVAENLPMVLDLRAYAALPSVVSEEFHGGNTAKNEYVI